MQYVIYIWKQLRRHIEYHSIHYNHKTMNLTIAYKMHLDALMKIQEDQAGTWESGIISLCSNMSNNDNKLHKDEILTTLKKVFASCPEGH